MQPTDGPSSEVAFISSSLLLHFLFALVAESLAGFLLASELRERLREIRRSSRYGTLVVRLASERFPRQLLEESTDRPRSISGRVLLARSLAPSRVPYHRKKNFLTQSHSPLLCLARAGRVEHGEERAPTRARVTYMESPLDYQ